MRDNFTSINVIIDKSGSMSPLANETLVGFNKFLAEQKQEPGEAMLTLCTFNHDYHLVHDCLPLASVLELTEKEYKPSGYTALLDAMGATMDSVGAKLAAMKEEDRPSKVIFLVITDGEENSSHIYNRSKIKDMVTHQSEKYQWQFVFLGANIDAIAGGESLGVSLSNSKGYAASAKGTQSVYSNVSDNLRVFRSMAPSNKKVDFFDLNRDATPIEEDLAPNAAKTKN